jgi:predicted dehydrogenase
MMTPGHERWHPNPDFYYQPGGGPLLDMGPYYVTTLVTLLGPVVSVVGAASHTRATRVIGSGPRAGETIPVDVDTHVTGVLRHASGALSTLVMSFDSVATRASEIEVHGQTGSLVVPDPNRFDGDVRLHELGGDWKTLPPSAGYREAGRGYGVADLATTPPGDPARASGDVAYHVLDIMTALLESADSGTTVTVESTCERPAVVPLSDAPR